MPTDSLQTRTEGSGEEFLQKPVKPGDTHSVNVVDNLSTDSDAINLDESSTASVSSVSVSMTDETDPGNLTLSDGKLDKEKLASLSFPTADISKSLEKSFHALKKGDRKDRTPPSREAPSHSTPALVETVSTQRRSSKRHMDQKAKTDALLLELGL